MTYRTHCIRRGPACLLPLALLLAAAPGSAQGGILARVNRAAQEVTTRSLDVALTAAPSIQLEERGLETLNVGQLTLGLTRVDVRGTVAVRVHAYFHNPTDQAVSIPFPDPETFALVTGKGVRIKAVSGMKVKDFSKDATEITIPAGERVLATILFAAPGEDAEEARLQVGSLGSIGGIPLKKEAAAGKSGAANVWNQPSSPAPPPL